jgi:hypothetical protein
MMYCASLLEFESFLIHSPELSAAETPSSEAGAWREMSLNFGDEVSLFRVFNTL